MTLALLFTLALPLAAPPDGGTTAMGRTAREVAAQIAAAQVEGPVAVAISANAPELARAFFTVLSAELQRVDKGALLLAGPLEDAELRAKERGAGALLRVALAVDRGLLSVRGDVHRVRPNFWAGHAETRPPGAAIASSTEADAHALTLSAPVLESGGGPRTPLRLAAAPLALLNAPTAALASGDLDGDGRDELVALTDSELLVFAPGGTVIARRALRELPRSPTPSREPFGTLALVRGTPSRIGYFSGRHGRGEWLTLENRTLLSAGPLTAPTVAVAAQLLEGRWQAGTHLFTLPPALPDPLVHVASWSGQTGAQLLGVRPDGTASWAWVDQSRPPVPLLGLGAATALVDLDGDGAVEIATTSAEFAPAPDFVRVTDGAQTTLWEVPLERGRVLQLIAADLDGDRSPELIAAVWLPDGTTELRVLRRVAP